MLQVDEIVRELRRKNVGVLDSRDRTSVAKWGKAATAAATAAFLGRAVLGGIIAGIMAAKDLASED